MILTLSSENVRNTVFTDERRLPVFKSDTPSRLGGVRTTTISRQTTQASNMSESEEADPILGCIAWHTIGSSIFTIGKTRLKSNVFLPKNAFFGRKRTFTGPDGRRYRWEMHRKNVVLFLDDASAAEIARYHRGGRALGIVGRRRNAFLDVKPQAEHMLDLVILTFIYVEKLRMDKEAVDYTKLWTWCQ